jgi:hypothetical protein
MGEVITFQGLYKAEVGQAAAVTFYTFFSGFQGFRVSGIGGLGR